MPSDPSDPPGRLRPIIEACVAFGHESAPWVAFRDEFADLIQQVAAARRAPDGFADWFLGWLVEYRKLDCLIDRLDDPDPSEPIGDPDRLIRDYLKKTVASGVASRYREITEPRLDPRRRPGQTAEPVSDLERDEQLAYIRAAVRELEPGLRLPFWLQHLHNLGPLDDADLAAVAARTGRSPEAVRDALDRELLEYGHRKYPISTRTIGIVLDLPPLPDGKYAAVSQRLTRAADRLAARLTPPGEDAA